jgi:hypothetical protein
MNAFAPHDLNRCLVNSAGRNGLILEIISGVILRYRDLKTTRGYPGEGSESDVLNAQRKGA